MPSPTLKIAIIINPISGRQGPEGARRRAELAASFVEQTRLDAEVFVTERQGHAADLARAALRRGAQLCIAWGGDGTVNEVASALAFSPSALAVVPAGSGNGLARELGISPEPFTALHQALAGEVRLIDAGEVDGRLFFNVAGFGFDARVAQRFAAGGAGRRGLSRYLRSAATELLRYRPQDYVLTVDGVSRAVRPLVIALANSRQYGNGALIAPEARLDDGRLDVVVIDDRSPIATLVQARRLFSGTIGAVSGVSMASAVDVVISTTDPVVFHVDGEPHVGGQTVRARVRPGALRIVWGSVPV